MDVRTLRALEAGGIPRLAALEDKYTKEGVLGQGSFGTVWRVRRKHQYPGSSDGTAADPMGSTASSRARTRSSTRAGGSGSMARSSSVRGRGSGAASSSEASVYVAKELLIAGSTANRSRALAELAAREVRVLARLDHPNVVRYMEQISEIGRTYIVMEFCPGGDLKHLLKKRLTDGVFLREKDVLSMFRQLLRGVAYIHSRHLLHRDIKSANIFLTKSGRLKIGDFGLSKEGMGTVDQARTICGTPMYYAPEMVREAPYDAKADIWALGCVFYEILALKHPFAGVSMRDLPRKILGFEIDDPNPGRRYTAEVAAAVMRDMLCPAASRLPAASLLEGTAFQRPDEVPPSSVAAGVAAAATGSTPAAPSSGPDAAGRPPAAPKTSPPPQSIPQEVRRPAPMAVPPTSTKRQPATLKLTPTTPPKPKRPPPSADPTFAGREARLRRLLGEARSTIVASVSDAAERKRRLAECDDVVALVQKYADEADGAAPEDSTHRFMHAERVVTILGETCDDKVFSDVCVVLGIQGMNEPRARSAERDGGAVNSRP